MITVMEIILAVLIVGLSLCFLFMLWLVVVGMLDEVGAWKGVVGLLAFAALVYGVWRYVLPTLGLSP